MTKKIIQKNKTFTIGFNNNTFTLWEVSTKPLTIRNQLKGYKITKTFLQDLSQDLSEAKKKALKLKCIQVRPDFFLKGKGSFSIFIETKAQREKRERTKNL
tara:strand:+ start:281 stop:583 length:303 start_codon:yes stop_codon:yes gene_type:complete